MSLVLNDEQRMLQSAAREFFDQHMSIETFRSVRDANGSVQFSTAIWQQMVELGWGAMLLPEELEGLEFGISGMGLVCIEAARTLSVSPLQCAATLCVEALLRCRDCKARNSLLKDIASGQRIPAFAIVDGSAVTCAPDNGAMRLNGGLDFVVEAAGADSLVLVLEDQAVWVDLASTGISCKPQSLIDRRDYGHISFDSVGVSKRNVFSLAGEADQCRRQLNDIGAVITACELYGISVEAFARTRDYLCEREQFGQKIGAFQALQHRMAKVFMQLELLKSVLYDALQAVESCRGDAALSVSHAKVLANDTARLVCTEAIQLHGGMGITDELDIGLFYKRARVLRTVYGSTAQHKQRFARLSNL